MADWTTSYFGDSLLTKEGSVDTKTALSGKRRIGIYFSAHWCPPCRGFTPVLSEFYEQLKEEDREALEIIFVSSDENEAAFQEYYGSMPWIAVPFSNGGVGRSLSEKFGVRGIPTFIVLHSADGEIKDKDGRTTVATAKGNTSAALKKWE